MEKEKSKKLTEKQKRFIDFYIETGNATKACEMAGYSKKTCEVMGSQNLRKLKVFINQELAKKDEKRVAKGDEILEFLTGCLRGEFTEQVVISKTLGKGMSMNEIIDKKIGLKERIKAGELLGKRYGLFTPKNDEQKETLEKLGEILEQTKLNAKKSDE